MTNNITVQTDFPLEAGATNPVISPNTNFIGIADTSNGEDHVEVSAQSGETSILNFYIQTDENFNLADPEAGGEDSVELFGSVFNTTVDLGGADDLLEINTGAFVGSVNSSIFRGGYGNDIIRMLASAGSSTTNSVIFGGFGGDLIELRRNFTNTSVQGGAGNDSVQFMDGGDFASSFIGMGADDDLIYDNDYVREYDGSSLNGGGGDDTITIAAGTTGEGTAGTLITGGGGDDVVHGTAYGENTLLGGAGADFLQTFEDNDSIIGGGSCDTILVGQGSDRAFGEAGLDVIFGQDGQNTLDGGTEADFILGGTGDERIFGGSGNGKDTLVGGAGNDTVKGDSGDDIIFGDGLNPQTAGRFFIFGEDGTLVHGITEFGEEVRGFNYDVFDLVDYLEDGYVESGWRERDGDYVNDFVDVDAQLAKDGDCYTSDLRTEIENAYDLGVKFFDEEYDNGEVDGNGWEEGEYERLTYGPTTDSDYNLERGRNLLHGDSGNDIIFGGGGRDTIYGGTGNDTIIGSAGSDRMWGGTGDATPTNPDTGFDVFVQGLNSSFWIDEAIYEGGNWSFRWDDGEFPDVIEDFEATVSDESTTVRDRIAFANAGIDYPYGGSFYLVNTYDEDDSGTGFDILDATGTPGLFDWDRADLIIFSGIYQAGSFETQNNGRDALVLVVPLDSEYFADDFILGSQAVVLMNAGDQNFQGANFFGHFASET